MTALEEAVEAAAKAIYESEGDSWDEGTETAREFSRVHARAALTAAAPFIAAQAWEEGSWAAQDWKLPRERNPYRSEQ